MQLPTFLEGQGIKTEAEALAPSINAAVWRNLVYCNDDRRDGFRAEWKRIICEQSMCYRSGVTSISDSEHCQNIGMISERLSATFAGSLIKGRLRYGTSQKAFNLYLKYLWQLRVISAPPHCPVDRIVLQELGIDECWTKCDDQKQYMKWIDAIRRKAGPSLSVSQWENDVWLKAFRAAQKAKGKPTIEP